MKLKHLFTAFLAGAAMLVSCVEEELDLGTAEISVNPSELTFTEAEGSTSFSLFANRDWIVSGVPDWLALSQVLGGNF